MEDALILESRVYGHVSVAVNALAPVFFDVIIR